MKVKIEAKKFTPVSLVLETQAEVDALCGVFRHSRMGNAFPELAEIFNILKPHTQNTEGYYAQIRGMLTK